jgi:hypothetical protein
MALPSGHIFRINIVNDYVARRAAAADRWWRWQELAAVPVAVGSMLALTLALAAEPWTRTCRPATALPLLAAAALLFIAADLLLEPRMAWSRSRNNATMNTGCIAFLAVVLFCVATSQSLAWPMLYPAFIFPLSLVVPVLLGAGLISWIPFDEPTRRALIAGCLVLSAALILLGGAAFQANVSCHWDGG